MKINGIEAVDEADKTMTQELDDITSTVREAEKQYLGILARKKRRDELASFARHCPLRFTENKEAMDQFMAALCKMSLSARIAFGMPPYDENSQTLEIPNSNSENE